MNRKNGSIIWVLAGGYLVYTGGKLITEVIAAKPNGYQFMIVFGVIFIVFGGVLALKNISGLLKSSGVSETDPEETDEAEPLEEDFAQTETETAAVTETPDAQENAEADKRLTEEDK